MGAKGRPAPAPPRRSAWLRTTANPCTHGRWPLFPQVATSSLLWRLAKSSHENPSAALPSPLLGTGRAGFGVARLRRGGGQVEAQGIGVVFAQEIGYIYRCAPALGEFPPHPRNSGILLEAKSRGTVTALHPFLDGLRQTAGSTWTTLSMPKHFFLQDKGAAGLAPSQTRDAADDPSVPRSLWAPLFASDDGPAGPPAPAAF